MNLDAAKALLREIRDQRSLSSEEWCESYDTENSRAEICTRDRMTGRVDPIAIFLPECSYDDRRLMLKSPVYIDALLMLVDESFRRLKALQPKAKPKPKAANICAIKLKEDHLFLRFLRERYDLDTSDFERAKTKVRGILAVQSLNELDSDEAAFQRWQSLLKSFHTCRRAP